MEHVAPTSARCSRGILWNLSISRKSAIENSIDLALARQKDNRHWENDLELPRRRSVSSEVWILAHGTRTCLQVNGQVAHQSDSKFRSLTGIKRKVDLGNSPNCVERQQEFLRPRGRDPRCRPCRPSPFGDQRDVAAVYYQNEILPLRHKIVEQVQLQYNAMQVGTPRLAAGKTARNRVPDERYVQSLYNYYAARVELEQILAGRLLGANIGDWIYTHRCSLNANSLSGGSSEAAQENEHGGH